MPTRKSFLAQAPEALRGFRNERLFRLLQRAWRYQQTETIRRVRERGFAMHASYPSLLSNIDVQGTPISAIAMRGGVSRQAVSQRIQEVEKLGYVKRVGDPNDKRAAIVHFTPRGKQLLQNALEVVTEIEKEIEKEMGKKNFQQLKKMLTLMLGKIDPEGGIS